MELRPHQTKAVEMLKQSIRNGNKRIILAAPCSFGKTVLAMYLIKNAVAKGKRCLFICDRVKLIDQALNTFLKAGLRCGVIQGQHIQQDYSAPVQIASVQSLMNRQRVEADFIIIDEAHILYKYQYELMQRWSNLVFIGLSATPFSKGLGRPGAYQDLVVPITPTELFDQGFLTPCDYYGGQSINLDSVKRTSNRYGGTEYDPKDLASRYDKDKDILVGDAIKNYMKICPHKMGIAFAPSIAQSKYLRDRFNEAGISAEHIDGYMDIEEREEILKAHEDGDISILCNSQLLAVGFDSVKIECLLDFYPVKSKITFIQRWGRILRLCPGKDKVYYLDHASNIQRHGFPEYLIPNELDDGEKQYNEERTVKKEEGKEKEPTKCPQCFGYMYGIRCKCGYEIPRTEQVKTTEEELVKLTKKNNKEITYEQKQTFLSELLLHGKLKGYKKGWAANKYKERFGVWPNKIEPKQVWHVSEETIRYMKHLNIKNAKRKFK